MRDGLAAPASKRIARPRAEQHAVDVPALADVAQQVAPRHLQVPQLSPNTIVTLTVAACIGVGVLMAYDFKLAIGLVVGLCYLPLVLVNLPLGIALWVPSTFLTGLPGFDSASHAAGLVIALAWFGQLRAHASEQGRHVPRGLLLVVAVFIIWLALSMLWAERPGASFSALPPFVAAALMFTVLMTLDLTPQQIRLIAFSFIAGPSIGGLLVQALKAPFALVVDAVSFLFSALFLSAISPQEPPNEEAERGQRERRGLRGVPPGARSDASAAGAVLLRAAGERQRGSPAAAKRRRKQAFSRACERASRLDGLSRTDSLVASLRGDVGGF